MVSPTDTEALQGLDALMNALNVWNGGVILISHDERFITSVAKEVRKALLCSLRYTLIAFLALGMRRRHRHQVQRRRSSLQGLSTDKHSDLAARTDVFHRVSLSATSKQNLREVPVHRFHTAKFAADRHVRSVLYHAMLYIEVVGREVICTLLPPRHSLRASRYSATNHGKISFKSQFLPFLLHGTDV